MGTDERGYQTAYLGAGADVSGFFFALPVKLALVMENARRMEFRAYNDYEPIEKLLPEHFTCQSSMR